MAVAVTPLPSIPAPASSNKPFIVSPQRPSHQSLDRRLDRHDRNIHGIARHLDRKCVTPAHRWRTGPVL